jgi:hypothetical protein
MKGHPSQCFEIRVSPINLPQISDLSDWTDVQFIIEASQNGGPPFTDTIRLAQAGARKRVAKTLAGLLGMDPAEVEVWLLEAFHIACVFRPKVITLIGPADDALIVRMEWRRRRTPARRSQDRQAVRKPVGFPDRRSIPRRGKT